MLGTIGFENLSIDCIIGERPEERISSQTIFVTLHVEYDISRCALSDQLMDSIDYVSLAEDCREEALKGQYQMIECYASRVLDRIFRKYPIEEARIVVRKPNGLDSAECAFVNLVRRNA